eukprot:SAG31_NODE_4294_length_3375_cov_2.010989_2_plen_164_part_00
MPELAALAEIETLSDLPVQSEGKDTTVAGAKDTLQSRAAAASVDSPRPWTECHGFSESQQPSPFLKLRWPSEKAALAVAQRAVLLRGLIDVWGEGKTYAEAIAAATELPTSRRCHWDDKRFLVRCDVQGQYSTCIACQTSDHNASRMVLCCASGAAWKHLERS